MPQKTTTPKSTNKALADACWKAARPYRDLGTLGMIRKCYEKGFSRQILANVFGRAFVFKALGKVDGENLTEPSWR